MAEIKVLVENYFAAYYMSRARRRPVSASLIEQAFTVHVYDVSALAHVGVHTETHMHRSIWSIMYLLSLVSCG
jgi:hypothetical protein